jgi:hypothetical protein
MMDAQILHSTLIRDRAIAAAGETFQVDLPVNPLSAILLTLKAANNGAVATFVSLLNSWAAKYTSWRVTYRGATIVEGQTEDLWLEMARRERWIPSRAQVTSTDGDVSSITWPLMFGRKLYDHMQCFPATRRGDLVLEVIAAADAGELDTHILQAETIELLDARPRSFLKVTTIEQAMAAAGINIIELPIGNKLLGVLLRPFVFPSGALFTSSFGEVRTKVDNVEVIDAHRNWETLHGMLGRRVPANWNDLEHAHGFEPVAGVVTLDVRRDGVLNQAYGYLDWDPTDDGAYALDTRGAAHVQLEMTSDQADGANTSRVLPVELVELGAGA